jgi:hypothetical protein
MNCECAAQRGLITVGRTFDVCGWLGSTSPPPPADHAPVVFAEPGPEALRRLNSGDGLVVVHQAGFVGGDDPRTVAGTVQGNYIHDPGYIPGDHTDGISSGHQRCGRSRTAGLT